MPEPAIAPDFLLNLQPWLGIGFDILVLTGVLSLWLLWKRTTIRQQHAETILKETAGQLELATRALDEALGHIDQLKKQDRKTPPSSNRRAAEIPKQTKSDYLNPTQTSDNQINRILKMHGRGDSPESIAGYLDMPEAKVRLILKLWAGENKG